MEHKMEAGDMAEMSTEKGLKEENQIHIARREKRMLIASTLINAPTEDKIQDKEDPGNTWQAVSSETEIDADNSQARVSGRLEGIDIIEAENDFLFASPKVGEGDNVIKKNNQEAQQQIHNTDIETDEATPRSKGFKVSSKFWQTPNVHITSPFTPEDKQLDLGNKGKEIGDSIITEVQNYLNQAEDSLLEEGTPITDNKELEHLADELNQVFSYDNINNNTVSQKENLIQKIIKLGGNGYTVEDLRKDILRIELEDSLMRKDENVEIVSKVNKEGNIVSMSNMLELNCMDQDKNEIGCKIFKEL